MLDDNGEVIDGNGTLRGVVVLIAAAGRSATTPVSESVLELSSARARATEASNFLIVILGRDSAGNGRAGISAKTAEADACNSGRKLLGDRCATRAGEGF